MYKMQTFCGVAFPCLPTEQQTLANRVNWSINYLMTSNLSSFYLIFLSRTCRNVLSSHSTATPAHFFLPPQTRTCNTKPVILKEIKGIITKTSHLSKNFFPFWPLYQQETHRRQPSGIWLHGGFFSFKFLLTVSFCILFYREQSSLTVKGSS